MFLSCSTRTHAKTIKNALPLEREGCAKFWQSFNFPDLSCYLRSATARKKRVSPSVTFWEDLRDTLAKWDKGLPEDVVHRCSHYEYPGSQRLFKILSLGDLKGKFLYFSRSKYSLWTSRGYATRFLDHVTLEGVAFRANSSYLHRLEASRPLKGQS